MHELAIAQNIKESVERELETHAELKKILCIKVVIGGMHAVVPEALRFNFSIVCRESRLEDAELAITEIPVKGDCGSCGKDFEIRDHLFSCPFCGSVDISIRGGNEFFIESITGEG
jgi:hydrogenase nickel incorporation protein HypA/HybF